MKKYPLSLIALLTILLFPIISAQAKTFEDDAAQAQSPVVEIKVMARKFEFEPNKITVEKGQRVRLLITSEDVDHGFEISELGVDEKIKAGQTATVEFVASKAGKFRFRCSVFCGEGHQEMVGQIFVTEAKSDAAASAQQPASNIQLTQNVNVSFEGAPPGSVIVESNGQKFIVDPATKTVKLMEEAATPTAPSAQPETEVAEGNEPPHKHVSEPYDYRLINVPTPKHVIKGSLNLYFTHRFAESVRPLRQSGQDLLGLDSFAISSFGLSYGITDRLYVSAYRSPICQTGLCKTIEIGVGYHWLDEAGRSPIALSTFASVEGDDNFTEKYTYNIQAMLARSVTKYAHVFFSPAVHFRANASRRFDPRPENFFPPQPQVLQFAQDETAASFGFGVSAHVRPTTSILFEYTPRVGFKLGRLIPIFNSNFTQVTGFVNETHAEIGFGIEKRIGRHSFSLTFSNTQTTTTSRYNSSNLALPPKRFTIGFNLYRRFLK